MALIRWDPSREVTSFRRQMDDLMESFFGRDFPALRENGWSPEVDISETKDEIQVKMDVPGMEQKDISISLSGDNLMIKGERKSEKEEKGKHFHRIERSCGGFQRVIALPVSVDAGKIKADMDRGVLSIHMPKKAEAKPKEIPISSK